MRKEAGQRGDPLDFKRHPEAYRMMRGEQGVFHTPPYTEAMASLWRFRTPALAKTSAAALLRSFASYRDVQDFVGMDIARKFLQMGVTRARRYARHRGGRKWGPDGEALEERVDELKEEAARIFEKALMRVRGDPIYREGRAQYHRQRKKKSQPL